MNLLAHLHQPVSVLSKCYARLLNGTRDGIRDPIKLATRDFLRWWRDEAARQARFFARVAAAAADAAGADHDARVFYRASPASNDRLIRAAARAPATVAALYAGREEDEYSHQLYAEVNDLAVGAFHASGLGVIDLETMLGVRVDNHPASSNNGTGDSLHFCLPGAVDWALDLVLEHVRATWDRRPLGSGKFENMTLNDREDALLDGGSFLEISRAPGPAGVGHAPSVPRRVPVARPRVPAE